LGFAASPSIIERKSLLPPGEGQDEGIINLLIVFNIYPLTPTLSRRERVLSTMENYCEPSYSYVFIEIGSLWLLY
jgi:hypothetical protein